MTMEKEQLEAEIAERDARIEQLSLCNDELARKLARAATELATLESQQPSAGVVLPERMPRSSDLHAITQHNAGWNSALDEVARLNPCRAQAVPDGEELKVLRAFYQCCASITDQLADSPKSALARLVEAVKDAAASANSEQARSCVTCNGVGIIGHSTLCPECATAPSTQRKESGDE